MRTERPRPETGGFTLVEMVIVLAIIATLATLGMQSYQMAQDLARATACRANQRAIQEALVEWAGRHDQPFVRPEDGFAVGEAVFDHEGAVIGVPSRSLPAPAHIFRCPLAAPSDGYSYVTDGQVIHCLHDGAVGLRADRTPFRLDIAVQPRLSHADAEGILRPATPEPPQVVDTPIANLPRAPVTVKPDKVEPEKPTPTGKPDPATDPGTETGTETGGETTATTPPTGDPGGATTTGEPPAGTTPGATPTEGSAPSTPGASLPQGFSSATGTFETLGWNSHRWLINTHAGLLKQTGSGGTGFLATVKQDFTDFTWSVSMHSGGGGPGHSGEHGQGHAWGQGLHSDSGRLAFRIADTNNYYAVSVGADGRVQLGRMHAGHWEPAVASGPSGSSHGSWSGFRIHAVGGHIQVEVDGRPVIDWTDSDPILAGRVGVMNVNSNAQFRDGTLTAD